jgi:threonyl-tRNA synthetase
MCRNELAGALSGLTRVRRFQQDDAHIFCRHDQIESEIRGCIEFVQYVYKTLRFGDVRLRLATRPDKSMGSTEQWTAAEQALRKCLSESNMNWSVAEGDGAFYGPKIDITVSDATGKRHQCATIQLDFQLPQRFALEYTGSDNAPHTPVMIHRAILGSVERLMAMLMEQCGGDWPLWLSPRQVCIIPIHTQRSEQYVRQLHERLRRSGLYVDVADDDKGSLQKRIADSVKARYNYIAVIGDKEQQQQTLAIRERGSTASRTVACDDFVSELQERVAAKQ